MLEKFHLRHPVLEKYEADALASFEENKYRFSRTAMEQKCADAALCEGNRKLILDFTDFAHTDEDILKFMWLYYYFQFETDECYLDNLWEGGLGDVPVPAVCEEKFPGALKAVVYLAAADHLADLLKQRCLSEKYITDYYENYKRFADMNVVSHDTYGFCRLASFVYAYAYPFIITIGRFRFQLTHFKDYCEVYTDENGKRVIIATPLYTYNNRGYRDENSAFAPVYEKDGNQLTAHTFNEKGLLVMTPQTFDLSRLTLLYSKEDIVATIHIPAGGKLTPDIVDASIQEAKQVLPQFFPDMNIRAIVCQTWFLDTQLQDILPPESNMLKFQKKFDLVMAADNQNHSIFDHIFNVKPTALENLVPKNNFQKTMLERALRGEKLYWCFGILKDQGGLCDDKSKN